MDDDKGKWLLKLIEENANVKVIQESNTNIVGGPKKQIKRPEKIEAFL